MCIRDSPKGEADVVEESVASEELSEGTVKLEENVIYEEISEEEAGITRRQFLSKALRISFGAFAGIQLISYLGFLWPKVSGGFGSKIDAGSIEDIKDQIFQADGSVISVKSCTMELYILSAHIFDKQQLNLQQQLSQNQTVTLKLQYHLKVKHMLSQQE